MGVVVLDVVVVVVVFAVVVKVKFEEYLKL